MDWRLLLEQYRSQLGWLALAGVALLAVKRPTRWPPKIDYTGSAHPTDRDTETDRIVAFNRIAQALPATYPDTLWIPVGQTRTEHHHKEIKITPGVHFMERWIQNHRYVENDSIGLIGRFPSMAMMALSMTADAEVELHKNREGGSVVESAKDLEGRVKYTGTRVRKRNMVGGSGRLAMPFHEALIIFEGYRFKDGTLELELINVLPRERRSGFSSQYDEMNVSTWPDAARIDPITPDSNETPRPTYGFWLHEPITYSNWNNKDAVEWLPVGTHEQAGNFSLKNWKRSAKAVGIKPPSSRPPVLAVDPEWKNWKLSERRVAWRKLCEACPELGTGPEGIKIAKIKGRMTKKDNRIKASQTLLGWDHQKVQRFVDQICR